MIHYNQKKYKGLTLLKPFYYSAFAAVGIQHDLHLVPDQNFYPVHPHLAAEIGENFLFPRSAPF